MSTETIPVTEVKNRLTSLVKNIRTMWDRVIITRNGKNEAVIVSYEEYESWLETLSLDEDEKSAISAGRKAVTDGNIVTLDEAVRY